MAIAQAAATRRDRLEALAGRIDPDDPAAQNNLGVVFFRHGLAEPAIQCFARALTLDAGLRVARRNLEVAEAESGAYDRRIAELSECLHRNPDDTEARRTLARIYVALGQHDLAIDHLQALVDEHGFDGDLGVRLGLAERARGNLGPAREWLEQACAADPQAAKPRRHLGVILHETGRVEEAYALLVHAARIDPDDAEIQAELAFVLGDLGRHEEARSATQRSLQLSATGRRSAGVLSLDRAGERRQRQSLAKRVVPEGALAHHRLGLAFLRRGRWFEALREFRLALEEGDDREVVLPAIALTQLLQREHLPALDLYDRLVQEQPHAAAVWNERGVVLHQLGRFGEAAESYERALTVDPDHMHARNNHAVVLVHLGREAEAIGELERAVFADPLAVVPRVNVGLLLLRAGRHDYALDAFRKVVDEAGGDVRGWNGIGYALTELNRYEDARAAYAKAVEADPEDAEAHYGLSFSLSHLGQYDDALREVMRAQSLDAYYRPGRFQLSLDMMLDAPHLRVIPEISADVTSGLQREGFAFSTGQLDDVFRRLDVQRRTSKEVRAAGWSDALHLAETGDLPSAVGIIEQRIREGADTAEANAVLARLYAARGLHGEALERFRRARAASPGRFDLILGEIRQLLALGRSSAALGEAVEAARAYPGEVDALAALAEARLASGDAARAREAIRAARERAPARADLVKIEGDVAAGLQDVAAAESHYRAATEQEPGYIEAWMSLGRVCEQRGDDGRAEDAYRSALEADPGSADARLALADVRRRQGDGREAVNLLVDVLTDDPTNLTALHALGRALLDDGRTVQALEAFERLLAFEPDNVRALFLAAVAEGRLRRFGSAVRRWDRVAALDPDGPFAVKSRELAQTAMDLQHLFPAGEE